MSDTLMTVFAIFLAVVLMFVFPLITMADRTDDVAQLSVKAATTEFVDQIRTTGRVTQSNYDKYVQQITSTGNTYDVEMEIQVKDENLSKKGYYTESDRIGENVYYSVYTSQIESTMKENNGIFRCKEGDIVSVSVKNTNQTLSQQLKNFFYLVTGKDTYTIAAEHAGIVTANGK